MLKEGCEADAVVGHMLFLAHDCDVVLSCPCVKFEEFLSGKGLGVSPGLGESPHSSNWVSVSNLHEADADHAQADNDNSLACTHRHIWCTEGVVPKWQRTIYQARGRGRWSEA